MEGSSVRKALGPERQKTTVSLGWEFLFGLNLFVIMRM